MNNILAESVTSAICKEPEGDVERFVYPMDLSLDNLRTFWEKSKDFRTVFREEIKGDFKKFCEMFISQVGDTLRSHGLFWVIDDFVGVYYITHITQVDCEVHYTFFDKRHKGREQLTRNIIAYVFKTYGFQRMNVEVPLYASHHTFGFIHALGFKKEGTRRSCIFYKDQWFDATMFGLLREEALSDR